MRIWETHLRSGDLLVLNDTRVFPARLVGHRVPSGGAVECLLLRKLPVPQLPTPNDVTPACGPQSLSWELEVEVGSCEDGTRSSIRARSSSRVLACCSNATTFDCTVKYWRGTSTAVGR